MKAKTTKENGLFVIKENGQTILSSETIIGLLEQRAKQMGKKMTKTQLRNMADTMAEYHFFD